MSLNSVDAVRVISLGEGPLCNLNCASIHRVRGAGQTGRTLRSGTGVVLSFSLGRPWCQMSRGVVTWTRCYVVVKRGQHRMVLAPTFDTYSVVHVINFEPNVLLKFNFNRR